MEFRKVAAEVVADSPEWEFGIPLEVDTVPVVDKEGRLLDILAELDKAGSVVVDSLALDCTMDREGWNWDTFLNKAVTGSASSAELIHQQF
jgi:hypothetical protein